MRKVIPPHRYANHLVLFLPTSSSPLFLQISQGRINGLNSLRESVGINVQAVLSLLCHYLPVTLELSLGQLEKFFVAQGFPHFWKRNVIPIGQLFSKAALAKFFRARTGHGRHAGLDLHLVADVQ